MGMLCCGRKRGIDEGSEELERHLIGLDTTLDGHHHRLEAFKTAGAALAAVMGLWPVVLAIAMGLLMKAGMDSVVKSHWVFALVLALGPEVVAALAHKYITSSISALERKHIALQEERVQVLERIKTELPMRRALALLMQYDPKGDHKVRIDTVSASQSPPLLHSSSHLYVCPCSHL